ncbi:hypothetical protein GGH96_005330 [Coemansia sp. RSA 1972]|nr:hypothetical protein GGH96_005330 [Coemansia sp. RSA 1972]
MDRVDRRNQLCRELKGHGSEMPFETLLAELKLGSEYDAFQHRFRGVFAAMAFRAIAYDQRTAVQPTILDSTRTTVEAELTRDTDAGDSVHAHLRRDLADEDQNTMRIDVNISKDPTDSSVNIHSRNRIEQPVNSRGRMAHKFRVEKNGKQAIIKLSWSPVDQLPESAVYDALKAANIPNIPSIIDSGIIIEKSFGYRVEYLIIEDYGEPLTKYLRTFSSNDANRPSNVAARVMHRVVECIYGAWNAGILHRNITADSVVVKGGQARIIDWGHAKFVKDDPVDVDTLAAKWLFDKNKVAGDDGSNDPITGTLYYTSIPVLIGATQQSIANDVESVLYVVIDALSKLNTNPPNFGMVRAKLYCSTSLAIMRGCCMGHDHYMKAFGVAECSELFSWLADTFREYLFVRYGEHIGYEMAINPEFVRTVEIEQLERILEQCKERIHSEAGSQNAPSNMARTLEEAQSQALPVETSGASTSATKRPRRAAAYKPAGPPRRSERIKNMKKR